MIEVNIIDDKKNRKRGRPKKCEEEKLRIQKIFDQQKYEKEMKQQEKNKQKENNENKYKYGCKMSYIDLYRSNEEYRAKCKEYLSMKIQCDICGKYFTRGNMSNHNKSVYHLAAYELIKMLEYRKTKHCTKIFI